MINYPALAATLSEKLEDSGVKFTEYGYPIIPGDMLLRDFPSDIEMYPVAHWREAANKKKSILCWYENDKLLIGHINNLDKWIQIFKEFYAVTGVDLSPCVNADLEQQKMAILLNQLLTAYMAIHGIRILANFRTGGFETINSLSGYPLGICYSVGMLGCSKRKVLHGTELMQAKLLNTCPKKLLIYGSADKQLQELINKFAIPFVVIPDFKTRCFQAKREVTYAK
jgi:hypothetical protein